METQETNTISFLLLLLYLFNDLIFNINRRLTKSQSIQLSRAFLFDSLQKKVTSKSLADQVFFSPFPFFSLFSFLFSLFSFLFSLFFFLFSLSFFLFSLSFFLFSLSFFKRMTLYNTKRKY